MGLLAWFNPFAYGKKPPPDYESLLARLATEIDTAKRSLAEITLRERRLRLLLHLYGFGLWSVWVGLGWLNAVPWGWVGLAREDGVGEGWRRGLEWGGVIGWPVLLYALSRLLSRYYTRQTTHEQRHLAKLLKEQRDSLEEVKRSSGWYKTKELLDRFEDGQGAASARPSTRLNPLLPPGHLPGTPTPSSRHQPGSDPRALIMARAGATGPGGSTPRQTPVAAAARGQPGSMPAPGGVMSPEQVQLLNQAREQIRDGSAVLPVPQKKWYDHLADKLMGEDPSTALQNKYALVCGRCFRHNGLVGDKREWENTKYYCRHCNAFNPSPNDRHASVTADPVSPPITPVGQTSAPTDAIEVVTPAKKVAGGSRDGSSVRQRKKGDKGDKSVAGEDRMEVDDEESL